ncbi:MAG: Holliday junction branch migration protein RuvA [Saccharofermentans sp.]|nr:Holliday junction branch migration protein RuvA [Saccharofermentans sp.]
MYSYIKGELVKITDDIVVVDNNGIGYEIICPFALSSKLGHIGTDVCVWIYQSVREDDISLYGFSEPEQKDMFLLLITVSGIGPKVAHSICSQLTPDKFALAVMGSDVKALTGVKGLGKKGAERIVLELKDKLKDVNANNPSIVISSDDSTDTVISSSVAADAVEALMVLGYKQADAANAVSSVYSEDLDLQAVIRKALKSLAR